MESVDYRLKPAAILALLLFALTSRIQAADCTLSGELEPPLRGDEFFYQAFSPASGYDRTALFQVPASAPPSDRTLVILLHGGGGQDVEDLLTLMRSTGWVEIAESEGIVLVYPTALRDPEKPEAYYVWNDGRLGADVWSMPDNQNVDDVGYINELIDLAQQDYGVGERVFVMGASNGGMMTFRLASDPRTRDRIKGIAPLISQIPRDRFLSPLAAVPILFTVGTADPLIPFGGGDILIQFEWESGLPIGDPVYSSDVVSAFATLGRFLSVHGCSSQPEIVPWPDTENDGTRVLGLSYCGPTNEVQAYFVIRGGHRWPGWGDNSDEFVRRCYTIEQGGFEIAYYVYSGLTTLDGFNATVAAWEFFQDL